MGNMITKKEYVLLVNNSVVEVTEDIYKEFYKLKNHEDYLERLDRKNGLIRFSDYDRYGCRNSFMNSVQDNSKDIEKIVEKLIETKSLYDSLQKLSPGERKLIEDIYFKEIPLRKISLDMKLALSTIQHRRDKILNKLRSLIKNS